MSDIFPLDFTVGSFGILSQREQSALYVKKNGLRLLKKTVKPENLFLPFSQHVSPLIGRFVPFAAVAAANCINIPLMRQR